MKRQRTSHGSSKPERIRFVFPGDTQGKETEEYPLAEWEKIKLDQIDRACADDSCPSTQQIGKERRSMISIRLAKEHVAALRVRQLPEQSRNSRRKKNVRRDQKIHDCATRGESQMSIAISVKLSESAVSRILKKPHP